MGLVTGNFYLEQIAMGQKPIRGGGAITFQWAINGKYYDGIYVLWNKPIVYELMPNTQIELALKRGRKDAAIPVIFYD